MSPRFRVLGLVVFLLGSLLDNAYAQELWETRTYKGGDLFQEQSRFVSTITNAIAPFQWEVNGGKGTIVPTPNKPGSFDISQTPKNHERIQELLVLLSKSKDAKTPISNNGFWGDDDKATALRESFQSPFEFQCEDARLEKAVSELAAAARVPIELDQISDAAKNTKVRCKGASATLGRHLDDLMAQAKTAYRIDLGKIVIVDRKSGSDHFLAIYPIPDANQAKNVASIMQKLMSSVTPDAWAQAGGTAVLLPLPNRSLLVSHGAEGHAKVAEVLGFFKK